MHLGNVYAAMLAWLSCRSKGGEFVLRMEDLDPQRSRKEYAHQIKDDLRWLGLTWDEEYTQSERFSIYAEHLKKLDALGLTYPCYCTRADILSTQAPHESDGRVVYKGTCRNLPREEGRAGAVRMIVPDRDMTFSDGHYGEQTINLARHCGDFILQRKDGAWAYQLAVVVDDALMGVTEVVRGRDLLLSVPQQLLLYEHFGYKKPDFYHLPLLINKDNQRLSKRDKSLDMGCIRERFTPEQIIGKLAYHAGLTESETPVTLEELLPIFSWDNVPTGDVLMDVNQEK